MLSGAALLPAPNLGSPPEALHYTGSQIYRCGMTQTGAGTASKLSAKLPYPAVIRQLNFTYQSLSATGVNDVFNADLTEDLAARGDDAPATERDIITAIGLNGTGDIPAEEGTGIHLGATGAPVHFDLWVPIPGPTFRLRCAFTRKAAGQGIIHVYFVIWKLRAQIISPGDVIRPRGSVDDPVCVRICPDGNGGDPGAPGRPRPPPPPEPPDPRAGRSDDAAGEPLPPPCALDPFQPFNAVALACSVP